ncbi:hypothetical protein EYF80_001626 [Liparis tanakae]|uniref:Uncharacterized protein n=1 Tax=Liparis tanakae TaxID=230148 RepID=A0A4Z2JCL4_9TELE|nr:hypothetical protein EYF80_001626 [Liparis tanakae]
MRTLDLFDITSEEVEQTTTEPAGKKSLHSEGYEEITKRIIANSKGRTEDPRLIIGLFFDPANSRRSKVFM